MLTTTKEGRVAKKKIRVDVFVGIEHDSTPAYRNSYRFPFGDAGDEIQAIVEKLLEDIADVYGAVEDDEEGIEDDSDDN